MPFHKLSKEITTFDKYYKKQKAKDFELATEFKIKCDSLIDMRDEIMKAIKSQMDELIHYMKIQKKYETLYPLK